MRGGRHDTRRDPAVKESPARIVKRRETTSDQGGHPMLRLVVAAAGTAAVLVLVRPAVASAPPVGSLPPGPLTTIATRPGGLVAIALPRRAHGLVWRLARNSSPKTLVELSEADVGPTVVVVYRMKRAGRAKVAYGLTRGETRRAVASRTFVVTARRP
jgi:hypothetical protein